MDIRRIKRPDAAWGPYGAPAMTVACLGHWYMSLLYLAPVAIVVAALAVVSRIEKRREARDTRTRPAAAPRAS